MSDPIMELITRCDREATVTIADIDRLRMSTNMTREQFYDATAMFIAEAFLQGNISFETADAVANTLWGVSEFSLAGRARAVFLAFDDGEYQHQKDPAGTDSVQVYTRPQLEAVLREK